jgi:ribonucleoside-diphosphate reductase alpha chain
MSIKALQEYTRFSKYAKYIPELKRRETWAEQVKRVLDMHKERYKDKIDIIKDELDYIERYLIKKDP